MQGKSGSIVTTYRLKLRCKHPDWAAQTKALYNEVLSFYFNILMEQQSMAELGNLELLRKLEEMTVVGRDKQPVPMKLPFEKLPVYFRRAAINAAIGHVRSFIGLMASWSQKKIEAESKGLCWKKKPPIPAKQFHASPVLYKGMYKEFGNGSVLIKLWNGSSWVWLKNTFCGRALDESAEILSPALVIRGKRVMLHVPVASKVQDTRTVRERARDGERFCAVSFTGSDVMAACVLFGSDGHVTGSKFIRGGKELAYRRKRLLNTIYRNRKQSGNILEKGENQRSWKKIENLNDYYAHLTSRRIIEYCEKNGVKTVVIPNYAENHVFLYGDGEGGFLGKRIIQYLGYKAWHRGIVMTGVRPHYTSNKCSHCREYIKRYNEGHQAVTNYYGGRLYMCPNGHRGNTALNTAKNIGSLFWKKFAFAREEKVG